jgi:hypothetical protein
MRDITVLSFPKVLQIMRGRKCVFVRAVGRTLPTYATQAVKD